MKCFSDKLKLQQRSGDQNRSPNVCEPHWEIFRSANLWQFSDLHLLISNRKYFSVLLSLNIYIRMKWRRPCYTLPIWSYRTRTIWMIPNVTKNRVITGHKKLEIWVKWTVKSPYVALRMNSSGLFGLMVCTSGAKRGERTPSLNITLIFCNLK